MFDVLKGPFGGSFWLVDEDLGHPFGQTWGIPDRAVKGQVLRDLKGFGLKL